MADKVTRKLNFGPGKPSASRQLDEKPCPFKGCPELIPKHVRGCAAHKNFVTEAEATRRRNHPRTSIYKDPRWKLCRVLTFERDGWTCVTPSCGWYDPSGRTLSCDHANEGGIMRCPDPFDPQYCATLCFPCSGRKDGKRGAQRSF